MNRLPQWLLAGGLLAMLGIILTALFARPDHGTAASTGVPGVVVAAGNGPAVAVPVAFAGPPAAPIVPALPSAGGVPRAFVAPNIQLAEAHWQGLEAIPLTVELKKKLKLPMALQGLLLDETTLAAAEAGLRAGDVLVAINGTPVTTLEGVLRESKRVKRLKAVTLVVQRAGRLHPIVLTVPDELGFAQVETAPMILSGDIAPHSYRGPCTQCHAIGTGGHMVPDPDLVTLPAPAIRAGVPRPHQDRGACEACHTIIP
ncbi:MAG: PDZ domain-containing protein [Magnetococcus sp. MYC-9]